MIRGRMASLDILLSIPKHYLSHGIKIHGNQLHVVLRNALRQYREDYLAIYQLN
jgi:hypothetical protein